jgi:hypothetical protein
LTIRGSRAPALRDRTGATTTTAAAAAAADQQLSVPISGVVPRRADLLRCAVSHVVSSDLSLRFVSFFAGPPEYESTAIRRLGDEGTSPAAKTSRDGGTIYETPLCLMQLSLTIVLKQMNNAARTLP